MDNRLFTLENNPIEIIAGDTVEIPYQVLKHDGKKVDLSTPNTKIEWILSPYENLGYVTLKKELVNEGEITYLSDDTSCFNVKLMPEDTLGKYGMYTYQIIIIDPSGAINRRMQGNILIWQNN